MKSQNERNKIINQKVKEIDITNYDCTEFGLGQLFTDIFGEELKCIYEEKAFYIYNYRKGIWKRDLNESIERLAEQFLSKICPKLVQRISNDSDSRKYGVWINKSQTNAVISSMLRIVRRKTDIAISVDSFDTIPNYFCLNNGVLDLNEIRIIDSNKKYLISKHANVTFDEEIDDTTCKDFIMDICGYDEDKYEYLLRMVIYAMQGDAGEHCMFMLYGPTTRNGKSTFTRLILKMFNEYGDSISQSSLSKGRKSNAGGPSPDIAKLKGKRFIDVPEVQKDLRIDVALVKALTGQDYIQARKLYQDFIGFINNAVFFMHMNRLPIIDDPTIFASYRAIVFPFDEHYDKNSADTKLYSRLTTEKALSGFLSELMRVMNKYKGISIKEDLPLAVKRATAEFENRCDMIGHFLKVKLVPSEGAWTPIRDIYTAYKVFTRVKGEETVSSKMFTQELDNRRLSISRRGDDGRGVKGYKLK